MRARICLLSALLVNAACAPEPQPFEEVSSLLEGRWTQDTDIGAPELVTRLVSPVPEIAAGDERRPAIVGAPPQRIRFDLRRQASARLEVATGLDASAADCSGEVLFRISWNGRLMAEETQRCGDASELAWRNHTLDVSSGGTLELETFWIGSGVPPLAAFGELRVSRAARAAAPPELAPDIVLVVIDTLRADALGTYGNGADPTPNLDALGERGAVFTRVFAPTPWTSPSTASLLTGLSPPEHGLGFDQAQYLPDSLRTLAEVLRAAGYDCAGFSANPLVSRTLNFDQGFGVFEELPWAHADAVVGAALEWWSSDREAPAFLYLHLTDPHDPYVPDADLRAAFAADVQVDWDTETRGLRRRMFTEERPALEALAGNLERLYEGEVRGVDRSLGPLFQALGTDALLVVTSDHGEEFLDHGLFGHGHQLHDATMHVPLILAGPGVYRNRREERRELVSVGGTLLRLARVPRVGFAGPGDLFDTGVAPVYFSTRRGYMRAEDWKFVGPTYGVISGRWRLHWAPPFPGRLDSRWELFDLERDPDARRNLAAKEPEVLESLRAMASSWSEAGDPPRLPTGQEEIRLLREIGYLGGEEDGR